MNDSGASRSKINAVLNSCSEARDVGLSLKLDYFLCGNRVRFSDGTEAHGTIRNYVNLDVDTIWRADNDSFLGFSENIQWICGKCRVYHWDEDSAPNQPYEGCGEGCLSICGDERPLRIRRLVINFPSWIKPSDDEDIPEGSIWGLSDVKVEELLFVVGDFEYYMRTRDVNFVTPAERPIMISNTLSADEKKISGGYEKTWPMMEKEVVRYMKGCKAQRAAERKQFVEG